MKTLTKLITIATSTLIAIFTITILLSTTPTYAAISVDVYCDGVEDQEKISAALADDTIINIHNDCVFSDYLSIAGYTGIVLQGSSNAILCNYDIYDFPDEHCLYLMDNYITINDISIVRGLGFTVYAGILFDGSNLYLNNVNISGFGVPMGINSGVSKLTATGLVITDLEKAMEFLPGIIIDIAIVNAGGDLTVDWQSERSDAGYAIGLMPAHGWIDMPAAFQQVTISNGALSGDDFVAIWDDPEVFVTVTPINQLVNCGFPAGSGWDICPDTGGGEEPGDGGGNDIEAPGTGIGKNNGFMLGITIMTLMGLSTLAIRKFLAK